MMFKDYQEIAMRKLLARSKDLLSQGGGKKIVFKSPTGSGKTIMMAEFLARLVNDYGLNKNEFAFIWTAPRKLHKQSKLKLEQHYENSRILECVEFDDLNDCQIGRDEILFFNWESINKKDAIYIRENERDLYLGKVIENTKKAGRKIVLVIDESHYHATSEISRGLIADIGPDLTIEVSATPAVENPDEIVSVPLEEVKIQGMIKKSVILNEGFKNKLAGGALKTALAEGTDALVLEKALAKRNELALAYQAAKINVNPLLLIQLPDRKTRHEDLIKDEIVSLLREKYGITVQNGKLAIYLSEEKENLANIAKNDQETEVLIFKQAIALGWDCPRAQILALFRDWKSLTFSVQTVGRIMRMPEPETGHYQNEILNHGFVYTNLADIEIKEDAARDYVAIYTGKRIADYKLIKLDSFHRLRRREITRLSPLFVDIFLQTARDYDLARKIETKNQKVELPLIADFEAKSADDLAGTAIAGREIINPENKTDLQKLFDFFARNNLSPFYPEDRSIGRIKDAIYYFFKDFLQMDYAVDFAKIVNIVLSQDNIVHFANVIDAAKEKYIAETQKRDLVLQKTGDWELPEFLNYSGDYFEVSAQKSALMPFYSKNEWKTESAFIRFLEASKRVDWWFKNGDRDAVFFAVPYAENGEEKPFYVDFIVKFNDGKIGLFDTKSGQTIETARRKSDGLQKYIKSREDIFGGIIANTDSKNFSGRWMLYDGKGIDLAAGNFLNWKLLDFSQ